MLSACCSWPSERRHTDRGPPAGLCDRNLANCGLARRLTSCPSWHKDDIPEVHTPGVEPFEIPPSRQIVLRPPRRCGLIDRRNRREGSDETERDILPLHAARLLCWASLATAQKPPPTPR